MIEKLISKVYLIEKNRQFRNFISDFPEQIDFETTNACNLRCSICPQPEQKRKVGMLAFKLARKVIDEVGKYGLRRMCLNLFGEPLLNKDFFEISRYAASSGKINHLYMSSNGCLIEPEIGKRLLESGLDKIIVSIDGFSEQTYGKIRCGGDYERVVNNVLEFIKIRRSYNKLKPILAVQIIKMNETLEEIKDFVRFWKSHLDFQDQVDIKEYFTWAHKVGDRSVRKTNRIQIKVPCLIYLWSEAAIHWNGDVSVCCYDADGELVVGNVERDSIYDIWHGEKYQNLRRLHLKGLIENVAVCKNCELTHRNFTINEIANSIARRFFKKR